MAWQFNPYAVPLFISLVPIGWIALIAWRRRAYPPVRYFLIVLLAAWLWVFAYAMELLSATLAQICFWVGVEYAAQSGVVAWLLFACAYSGNARWITRRRTAALLLLPALTFVLVQLNGQSGAVWSYAGVREFDGLVWFDRVHGPWFFVWAAYVHGLITAAAIILLRRMSQVAPAFRWQILLPLLGLSMPWLASIFTLLLPPALAPLDLAPFGVVLMCIPVGYSLFRYKFLDLAPAARDAVWRSISDPVIVCDAEYRVVELNAAAAKLAGAEKSRQMGFSLAEIDMRLLHLLSSDSTDAEITLDDNGQRCFLDARFSPLHTIEGAISGYVLVLRDVTKRKQAEEQALAVALERERLHLLQQFISNASHDFRTPITLLSTSAYLTQRLTEQIRAGLNRLRSPKLTPQGQVALLAQLDEITLKMQEKNLMQQETALHLVRLLEAMLHVLRLENQQFTFALHDLNIFMEGQVNICRPDAERKGLRVQFVPGDVPPLWFDSSELSDAVQRLLVNAVHYTPKGGWIVVSTRGEHPWAVIEVRDGGIGISAADLPHIFERFYRADDARSMSTGSAGLGLAIAKQIVEMHRGRITVESALGAGSTFRICLPLRPPDTA
ncbi:MAG: PAS domain-containing protein [Chloroflexi bacterium]|nr:PAS domain-containing protein [Chloroflexota bacterium]